MKHLGFFNLVLCFAIADNCFATCKYGCFEEEWTNEGSCGTNCSYTYDTTSQTLYVTSTGNNSSVVEGKFSSEYYEDTLPTIKNVIIDGEFKSIGTHAFFGIGATISGKNGSIVLPANGWNSFGNNANTLQGDIIVSDLINRIGSGAFLFVKIDGTLVIPDNVESIGGNAFFSTSIVNGKIYCAVKDCAQKIIDSCKSSPTSPTYNEAATEACRSRLAAIVADENKFEQAPEGCSYWSSEGCSKCTNSNYSLEYGYCYRKRYSLPEADAATSDDNENMIEWIFE